MRAHPYTMSKAEALADFRENVLPYIRKEYEQDRRVDGPARREAWNNYTDALQKDGLITRYQCDTWDNPF
jgi:hypothetical protein